MVATGVEVEIDRACKMVRKDHKQRWVYRDKDGFAHITDKPIPYREAVSVSWMPTVGAVLCHQRPAVLAHDAMNAL